MDDQLTLTAEERSSLSPGAGVYIAFLEAQVAALRVEVAKVQAQLGDAQARAQQHSGNSSRPPASDPSNAPKRPPRPQSGRKRGGQNGHPGHTRVVLAPEEITTTIDHRPNQCPSCTFPLDPALPGEGEPDSHQVWDVPLVVPQVTAILARRPGLRNVFATTQCPSRACAVAVDQAARVVQASYVGWSGLPASARR